MANQDHIALLKQGVPNWNTWRENNAATIPDLSDVDLNLTELNLANLTGANLSNANFYHTKFYSANLYRAIFSNANLSNAYLYFAHLDLADLSNANLSNVHLILAHLNFANLSNADLSNALLSSAQLKGANLNNANLNNANLSNVLFSSADLTGADLTGADLTGADLSFAKLKGADFTQAIIGVTSFGDQDFRFIKGLETVEHGGPSPLSINTIYLSQGDIPEAFIRGTGVPDSFLAYMKDIASKPIEYNSCFLSYSSKDEAFAKRLYADLQSHNVRCWFAPHDMRIGDEIRSRIDESIRIYDKLLLVLSQHSIESTWVKKEVETAFEKEQHQGKLVLFPVKLDDTVMQTEQAWAADIRRMRHIGDFQRWKDHDEYEQAFTRLLRDLKAESNR